MGIFISLLVIQLLIFAGLVFLLRNLLTKNITGATAHLDQMNQDFTKKQEEANKKTQEADQYYQTTLTKAREDALQFKERIEKEAVEGKDKMIAEARQESERIIERANKTREMLIGEINKRIEEGSLDKACDLTEHVVPPQLYKQLHQEWLEELLSRGLEELGSLQVSEDVKEAVLKTAFALTDAQKTSLNKKLKEKLGRNIALHEEVDSSVVAGAVVSLGSLVLDGSLRNKIKGAARAQQTSNKK